MNNKYINLHKVAPCRCCWQYYLKATVTLWSSEGLLYKALVMWQAWPISIFITNCKLLLLRKMMGTIVLYFCVPLIISEENTNCFKLFSLGLLVKWQAWPISIFIRNCKLGIIVLHFSVPLILLEENTNCFKLFSFGYI